MLGFPLRSLAVAATLPSRLGGMMLFRSPRFRRRFHAAVWPRFARPPATQTPPSFWKGRACASLGHSAAHRLLQYTYDARAHLTNVPPSPANGICDAPSRCRVVRLPKRTGSEPRRSLQSANPASRLAAAKTYVGRETRDEGPDKRAPLLVISRAPESPPLCFGRVGDSPRSEKWPKTSVRRRPAKSDTLGEIEVLSVDSKSETAVELTPPRGSRPCSPSRRPHSDVFAPR